MGDILSTVRGEYIPPHVKGVDQRRVRGACRLFIRGTGTWGVHWRWLATELEKRAGVPFSAATNVARFASCAKRFLRRVFEVHDGPHIEPIDWALLQELCLRGDARQEDDLVFFSVTAEFWGKRALPSPSRIRARPDLGNSLPRVLTADECAAEGGGESEEAEYQMPFPSFASVMSSLFRTIAGPGGMEEAGAAAARFAREVFQAAGFSAEDLLGVPEEVPLHARGMSRAEANLAMARCPMVTREGFLRAMQAVDFPPLRSAVPAKETPAGRTVQGAAIPGAARMLRRRHAAHGDDKAGEHEVH